MLTGRFAPSPTGPLHMGSLITALASYLDIKQRGGQWYVRIDNIDPLREDPNASEDILHSLRIHGLLGDRAVDYQSNHQQRYTAALERLRPHLFYCTCSRKTLAGHAIYPGTCHGNTTPIPDASLRIRVPPQSLNLHDELAGDIHVDLAAEVGDFIVRRRDGLWSYNFATAVDDGEDTTHVLRGRDLLGTTPQQIFLMQLLGLPVPAYAHLPLLHFAQGGKLSKQTHAPALDNGRAGQNLQRAMSYLGLSPPHQPAWSVNQWLNWGLLHWDIQRVPEALPPFDPD